MPEQLGNCPTCKNYEMKSEAKNTEFSNDSVAITSFLCAIIPYLLFGFCYIISDGKFSGSENGFKDWEIFFLYSMTAMIPVWIHSIYTGIRGLKTNDRIFSIIALALALLPVVLIIIAILIR